MNRTFSAGVILVVTLGLVACGGDGGDDSDFNVNKNQQKQESQPDGSENAVGDNTVFCEDFEALMAMSLESDASFDVDEAMRLVEGLEFPDELADSGEQFRSVFMEAATLEKEYVEGDELTIDEFAERQQTLDAQLEPLMSDIGGYVVDNCPNFTDFVEEEQGEVQAEEAQRALEVTRKNVEAMAATTNNYGSVTVDNVTASEPQFSFSSSPVSEPGTVMFTTSSADAAAHESWAAMATKADNNYCYAISVPRTEDAVGNPAGNADGQIMYGASSSLVDGTCSASEITEWSTERWESLNR